MRRLATHLRRKYSIAISILVVNSELLLLLPGFFAFLLSRKQFRTDIIRIILAMIVYCLAINPIPPPTPS